MDPSTLHPAPCTTYPGTMLVWQPLTIKSTKSLPFSTNFTIDTLFTGDTLRIDIKVVLPGVGTGLASFASIDYHLQEEQPVTLKLDVFGRGRIRTTLEL